MKIKWRLEVSKQVHAKKHSYGVLYQQEKNGLLVSIYAFLYF